MQSIEDLGSAGAERETIVLVDTHVHYYPFCPFSDLLDAAFSNFLKYARTIEDPNSFTGVLCLLETQGTNWYWKLMQSTSDAFTGKWKVARHEGTDGMLELFKPSGERLRVIPGRQVITSENLEVLIIGTGEEVIGRKPIDNYLDHYCDRSLVVLPWGVGKWLGARGKTISNQISAPNRTSFVLGDNGGRPWLWSFVTQFAEAEKLGLPVIPGSDPLPVAGQHRKAGGNGLVLRYSGKGEIFDRQSAFLFWLKSALGMVGQSGGQVADWRTYGKHDGLFNFIYSQSMLRLKPWAG